MKDGGLYASRAGLKRITENQTDARDEAGDLIMPKLSLTNLGKAVAKYAAADATFDDKPPISFLVRCYYWYYAIGFVVAVLGVTVGLTSVIFGPFPPLFGK